MNESSCTNNSFNLPSFSSPSLNGPNITNSYSTSQLTLNPAFGKIMSFSNNTNINTTTYTEHLNHHSSQLNLNLNLINRQMSNMLLNKKNVLNCNKKCHFMLSSFSFQFISYEHNKMDMYVQELNNKNIQYEMYIKQINSEKDALKYECASIQRDNMMLMEENVRLKNEIAMLNEKIIYQQKKESICEDEKKKEEDAYVIINESVVNYKGGCDKNGTDGNIIRDIEINGGNGNINNVINNDNVNIGNKECVEIISENRNECIHNENSNNNNNNVMKNNAYHKINTYNTLDSLSNLYTKKTAIPSKKKTKKTSISIKDFNSFSDNKNTTTFTNNTSGNTNTNINLNNIYSNSLHFNSICPSNRKKDKDNKSQLSLLLNPSFSSSKLNNKSSYHIIEKKVSLSQKKISLDKNTPLTPSSISKPQFNIIDQNGSIQYLYKVDIKNKSIIVFDINTKTFTSMKYQLETKSFPALYEEEGSVMLTTNNGLYIITGGTYKSFYFYSYKDNIIKKLPSLKHNHCKGIMILYNNVNIICISGSDNNTVELYDNSTQWKELFPLDEPRSGCGCLIMNSNYLYVLFGYNYNQHKYLNSICFTHLEEINDSKWEYLLIKENVLNIKDFVLIHSINSANKEGKVMIIGGNNKEGVNKNVYMLSMSSDKSEVTISVKDELLVLENNFNEMPVNNNISLLEQNENYGIDNKGNVYIFNTISGTFTYYPYSIK